MKEFSSTGVSIELITWWTKEYCTQLITLVSLIQNLNSVFKKTIGRRVREAVIYVLAEFVR